MRSASKWLLGCGVAALPLISIHCVGDDPAVSEQGPSDAAVGGSDGAAVDAAPGRPPFGAVDQIVAGEAFTCILGRSGQVKCWGSNSHGQLGQGSAAASRGDVSATSVIDFGGAGRVKQLAAAFETVCALFEDLNVRCWGVGAAGERGSGDTRDLGTAPADLPSIAKVDLGTRTADFIASGTRHFCVLVHNDNDVLCWGNGTASGAFGWLGRNDDHSIGDGPGEMGAALTAVPFQEKSKGLALGFTSTCALSVTGNLRCIGTGRGGQLGNAALTDVTDAANAPIGATGLDRITGRGPAYAGLLTAGGWVTWGDGANGRQALGTADDQATPVPLPGPSARAIATVSAGSSHRCVLTTDGNLYCFGEGKAGKLGYGDETSRGATPETSLAQIAPTRTGVAQVACGGDHTCVVLSGDGGVVCWGLNDDGQLGTGQPGNLGDTGAHVANNLPPIRLE